MSEIIALTHEVYNTDEYLKKEATKISDFEKSIKVSKNPSMYFFFRQQISLFRQLCRFFANFVAFSPSGVSFSPSGVSFSPQKNILKHNY